MNRTEGKDDTPGSPRRVYRCYIWSVGFEVAAVDMQPLRTPSRPLPPLLFAYLARRLSTDKVRESEFFSATRVIPEQADRGAGVDSQGRGPWIGDRDRRFGRGRLAGFPLYSLIA